MLLHSELLSPSNSSPFSEQLKYDGEEREERALEIWIVEAKGQDLGGRLNETCLCTPCTSSLRWMVEPAVGDVASIMPLQ